MFKNNLRENKEVMSSLEDFDIDLGFENDSSNIILTSPSITSPSSTNACITDSLSSNSSTANNLSANETTSQIDSSDVIPTIQPTKNEIYEKIFTTNLWPKLQKDGWTTLIQPQNNTTYYVPPNATIFFDTIQKVKSYLPHVDDTDNTKYVKEFFTCWDLLDEDGLPLEEGIQELIGRIEGIILLRDLELFISQSSTFANAAAALNEVSSSPILNENGGTMDSNISKNNSTPNQLQEESLNKNKNDEFQLEEKEKHLLYDPLDTQQGEMNILTEEYHSSVNEHNNEEEQKQDQPVESTTMEQVDTANVAGTGTNDKVQELPPPPALPTFEKRFPRYMGASHSLFPTSLFPPEKVQYLFHDMILSKHNLNTTDNVLTVKVSEEDIHTINFFAQGPQEVLNTVSKSLQTYIKGMTIFFNLHNLLSDPQSIQIDVLLSTKGGIGAFVFDTTELDSLTNVSNPKYNWTHSIPLEKFREWDVGIWITGLKKGDDSELKYVTSQHILKYGVCIIKVDDNKVKNRCDIIKTWSYGKSVLEADGSLKQFVKVTLCCSSYSDLSHIKADRVVGIEEGSGPLLRNGEVCKKWVFGKNGFVIKEKEVKDSPTSTATAYRGFTIKYQQVVEIEYLHRGFPKTKVFKSMWNQHKKLVGTNCPNGCSCPNLLTGLVSNVPNDVLDKVTSKQVDKTEVGFVNYFYKRFFSKIVGEYPDIAPFNALKKLVDIWGKHRSIRAFGLKCRMDCPCVDEWDMFLNALKNGGSNNADTAEKKVQEKSSPPPVDITKIEVNATTTAKSPTEVQIIDLSTPQQPKEQQPQSPPAEFSIDFNTHKPLGFYCITEETASPGSLKIETCKIYSVNPYLKLDPRLKPGTTVLASSLTIGKRMKVDLSSHKALQKRYETARKKGSSCKLQLFFANSNDTKYKDKSNCYADWTKCGQWQGNSGTGSPGWAGGAEVCVKRRGDSEVKIVSLPMAKVSRRSSLESEKSKKSKPNLLSLLKGTTLAKNDKESSTSVMKEPSIDTVISSSQSSINKIEETLKHARESLASSSTTANTSAITLSTESVAEPTTTPTTSKSNKKNIDGHIIKHRDTIETSEKELAEPPKKGKKRVLFCTNINTQMFYDPNSSIIDDKCFNPKKEEQKRVVDQVNIDENKTIQPFKKPKLLDVSQYVKSSNQSHLLKDIQQSQQPTHRKPELLHTPSADVTKVSNTIDTLQTFTPDSLSLAVRTQSIKRVAQILKSGQVDAQSKDSNNKTPLENIQDISQHHQQKLNESNMHGKRISMVERETLINELKELTTKKKLLKIFINAGYYINNARFMEDWVTIEMRINKVENIHISNEGVNIYTPYAFCTTFYNGQKQEPDTSVKHMAEKISWEDDVHTLPDGSVENIPNCLIRYNQYAYNDLDICIHLIMGSPGEVKNKTLGTARLKYDCIQELIHEFSSDDGKTNSRKIIRHVVPSVYLQRAATMELFLRKLPLDYKFIIRKGEEIRKKMYDLIHWIQSFNKETGGDILDYNIFAPNSEGFNLLHAAIYLEDAELVRHLLELGADPNLVCREGDSLALAKHLAETYQTVAYFDIVKVLESTGSHDFDEDLLLQNDDVLGDDDDVMVEEEDVFNTNVVQGPQHKARQISSNSKDSYEGESHANVNTPSSYAIDEMDRDYGKVQEDDDFDLYGDLNETPQSNKRKDPPSIETKPDSAMKRLKESEQRPIIAQSNITKGPTNPSISQNRSNEIKIENLPSITNIDWMAIGIPRCEFFNSSNGCTFGVRCKNLHVHQPITKLLEHVSTMRPDELRQFVDDQFIRKMNERGKDGKIYYTAAYRDENSVIYYAEKGNGKRSFQGIYWYPDALSAVDAVRKVVVASTYNPNDIKRSEYQPPLPHIQNPDWMCAKLGKERCRFFEKGVKCKYGPGCLNLHFNKPFASALKSSDKSINSRKLQPLHIHTNTRSASDEKKWVSAAYMCPEDKVIYYAEGGDGFCSAQGLFWYQDVDSAINRLGRVDSSPTKPKQVKNDVASIFPMLPQPKWMEVTRPGATRCTFFSSEQRCFKGAKCPNYHVHKRLGHVLDKKEVTSKDLRHLLKESFVFDKMEIGNDDTRWFTSAYCDPSENVIYYAEKGVEGVESRQGVYWYPTRELALDSIRKVVYASSLLSLSSDYEPANNTSAMQPYNQGQERMQANLPYAMVQDNQPNMKTHDMAPYMRTQDLQPYMRTQDSMNGNRVQDTKPRHRGQNAKFHKTQDVSQQMNPYTRTQDRKRMKSDEDLFETLVKSNLSNIHIKIHKGVSLLKVYWKTEFAEIEGEQRYTTNLNPHSNLVHLVYPSHCGGVYDKNTGLWWYTDERNAKAATYLIYLQELVKMNVIKDVQHLNDGTKLF